MQIWAASRQNQHNGFATSMDPDQLLVSLLVIEYVSEQHGSWSDCTDAQAGLDTCWSQMHYVGFVMTQLIYISQQGKLYPDMNSTTHTLVSRLSALWESVHKSRKTFETTPDRGRYKILQIQWHLYAYLYPKYLIVGPYLIQRSCGIEAVGHMWKNWLLWINYPGKSVRQTHWWDMTKNVLNWH
jgi:hypothetical protein